MARAPDTPRRLRLAGLLAVSMVAAPALGGAGRPAAFAWWLGGLAAFTGLYAASVSRLRSAPWWLPLALAAQAACVIVMVATQCRGLEGLLLVLVAVQLGLTVSRPTGLAVIAVQSLAMAWAMQHHWSLRSAVLYTPPYVGFQVLAFLSVQALGREARERAETARLEERLRIAREVHDAMGHHLAGLSLNLEALAQREEPSPALQTARALTRRLLDDVEAIVHTLGPGQGLDLGRALSALAAEIPRPRIHVEAEPLLPADPERSHALLRCCQEIVTNAVKHADAENLWIAIRLRDGQVELTARDDGSGASHLGPGQGLLGMRQRLEAMGGAFVLQTEPGAGFRICATLPARPS